MPKGSRTSELEQICLPVQPTSSAFKGDAFDAIILKCCIQQQYFFLAFHQKKKKSPFLVNAVSLEKDEVALEHNILKIPFKIILFGSEYLNLVFLSFLGQVSLKIYPKLARREKKKKTNKENTCQHRQHQKI